MEKDKTKELKQLMEDAVNDEENFLVSNSDFLRFSIEQGENPRTWKLVNECDNYEQQVSSLDEAVECGKKYVSGLDFENQQELVEEKLRDYGFDSANANIVTGEIMILYENRAIENIKEAWCDRCL